MSITSRSWKSIRSIPASGRQLRRLVRERAIDIVHSHDYKTNLLALLLSRATGAAALSTVHGWTGHSFRERWGYYPADKRVLARFPRVVAVSSEIGRELIRCGADPARVTTVLNGIDHRQFRRDPDRVAAARAALGAKAGEIVIGAVGRLEPQKRFDLLLEAFAAIVTRFPQARLFIVGDGSQRQALDAQDHGAQSQRSLPAGWPSWTTSYPRIMRSICWFSRLTTRARRMPSSKRWPSKCRLWQLRRAARRRLCAMASMVVSFRQDRSIFWSAR